MVLDNLSWKASGVTAIVEIKGFEDDPAKLTAATRRVIAVNNWGHSGKWAFHVCQNPQVLQVLDKEVEYWARARGPCSASRDNRRSLSHGHYRKHQ